MSLTVLVQSASSLPNLERFSKSDPMAVLIFQGEVKDGEGRNYFTFAGVKQKDGMGGGRLQQDWIINRITDFSLKSQFSFHFNPGCFGFSIKGGNVRLRITKQLLLLRQYSIHKYRACYTSSNNTLQYNTIQYITLQYNTIHVHVCTWTSQLSIHNIINIEYCNLNGHDSLHC